jgi:hypothetical protein
MKTKFILILICVWVLVKGSLAQDDKPESITTYKKTVRSPDSLRYLERIENMVRTEVKSEYDQKEERLKNTAIAEREKYELLLNESFRRQKIMIWSFVGLVLLILGGYSIRNRLNKKARTTQ